MCLIPKLKAREATVAVVSNALSMPRERTQYYLDRLVDEHKFLEWVGSMKPGVELFYELTHEGRGFLIEEGIL